MSVLARTTLGRWRSRWSPCSLPSPHSPSRTRFPGSSTTRRGPSFRCRTSGFGEVGGISVDAGGHIWVIHRPWTVTGRELGAVDEEALCCRPAPSVIEFDASGDVVQCLAGPRLVPRGARDTRGSGQPGRSERRHARESAPGAYGEWGRREHTVLVDHTDHVWVSNDNSHVLYKFTRTGEACPHDRNIRRDRWQRRHRTAGTTGGAGRRPETNELFVPTGTSIGGSSSSMPEPARIGVTGARMATRPRTWTSDPTTPGAEPARQFRGPVHGIALSHDGLVYVTDRSANRVQVFQRDGTFVREGFISPRSPSDLGSAYGVALSPGPGQPWVYINDGSNNTIWILRRDTLETVGRFGSYGRQGGQLLSAHSMAVDQDGHVYVGETRGRRVQRFRLVADQP